MTQERPEALNSRELLSIFHVSPNGLDPVSGLEWGPSYERFIESDMALLSILLTAPHYNPTINHIRNRCLYFRSL